MILHTFALLFNHVFFIFLFDYNWVVVYFYWIRSYLFDVSGVYGEVDYQMFSLRIIEFGYTTEFISYSIIMDPYMNLVYNRINRVKKQIIPHRKCPLPTKIPNLTHPKSFTPLYIFSKLNLSPKHHHFSKLIQINTCSPTSQNHFNTIYIHYNNTSKCMVSIDNLPLWLLFN